MPDRRARKERFVVKFREVLGQYSNCLVVGVDNVGSNQMQKVRVALRGKAVIMMGKNTLTRKIIRDVITEDASKNYLEALLPLVVGNVGFVFSNANLGDVRKMILESKVPASAKSGALAPCDVIIPPGPTPLDPGQTNFFQRLNISTKIARGAIEIVSEVQLLKKGDKVTTSHVALLDKLSIRPFFYTFKVTHVFEAGTIYSADALDMDQEVLTQKFLGGVRRLAALSIAIGYPTAASISHLVSYAYKKLLAVSLETEIDWAESKKYKEALKNPGAAAPVAAAAPAGGKPAAAPAKKEESDDEDDFDAGGLFD